MTERKHSELPWRPFYEGSGDWVVISEDGSEVCSVFREDAHFMSTGPGAPINEANSDFIIRACNNHYALVEALKYVREELQCECSPRERMSGHRVGCSLPEIADRIDTTLKQAKGESE